MPKHCRVSVGGCSHDAVNCDGDDLILSFNGNDVTGGVGADTFAIAHTEVEIAPTAILDFSEDEDRIVVRMGGIGNIPLSETVSVRVWEDGLGSDIFVDDVHVARVAGGQTLRADDIEQVPYFVI